MVVLVNQFYVDDAKKVLTEACDRDFETVIVIGFKDGNVHIKSSGWKSTASLVGAIELAKHHILNEQVTPNH